MKSKLLPLFILLFCLTVSAQITVPRKSQSREAARTLGDPYERKLAQIRAAIQNRKPDDARPLDQGAGFVLNNHPFRITAEKTTAQTAAIKVLHAGFIADRNKTKAQEAITAYKKVLADDWSDKEAFNAVANLYDTLNQTENRRKWLLERAGNPKVPADQRAEVYMSLAAKEFICANDISEMPDVKKLVQKDGKSIFTFSKPADSKNLETLRNCIQKGTNLINKSIGLNKDDDSAWSYKTSFLIQSARLAEMEERAADKDKLRADADKAKAEFIRLAEIKRKKKDARNKDYLEALNWIDTSIKIEETFGNLSLKALLLHEIERFDEAIKTGEKAIQIGKNSAPPANTSDFEKTVAVWKTNLIINPKIEEPPLPPEPPPLPLSKP